MLADGGVRIFGFGTRDHGWDGTWTRVCLAEPVGRVRGALIERLRWLGFAPLRAAWYAPGDRAQAAADAAAELGVLLAAISSGLSRAAAGLDPLAAWDLDALRSGYRAFIRRFAPVSERAGQMGLAEALLTRTAIMDTWRSFLSLDPDLPAELLPAGWPLAEAARLFHAVYDQLGPRATAQVRRVLARHDPAVARLAEFHTGRELAPRPAA
jgi:phenylacetic acid degradation operon negative regulatory protein